MPFQTAPGTEIIAGYRLVQRLGIGGFGEVWKTTAPGGLTKALKIVFGHLDESRATQELKALDRIKSVRHPFLLSLERVEIIDNQLLIVTELAERSLLERFQECKRQGLPGIPRDELLMYVRDAAEALDYMNENFGLQHLDIKPQNLLLVGGRIKIADFGLVKDLRGGSATVTGGVTPFYATPEAFDGRVSRFSDQYSLAVVYQEMMTGLRPFPGTTTLQLALQHSSSEPLLHPLPVMDRPAIARFATCREMVASLLAASPAKASEEPTGSADSGAKRKTAPSVIQRRVSKRPESPDQALKAPTIVADPAAPAPGQTRQVDGKSEEPASSMPLTRPACDTGLRPTLIIGIGGIACWTLRKLRRKLHRRYGDLHAVPAFRLLLLDTDRSALQQARQGEMGEALDASETMLMPLQRPERYRKEASELLKWLERRWLYNIPRSLLTEGLRPLGRLALVGNLGEILPQLRETLGAMTSAPAKATTAEATGQELRCDLPQVFVLASIAGGTGSGAVLDMAYAVRQVLKEGKMSKASVCGILVHATNQRPAEEDLARLNAYVTLNELHHYSRRSTHYPGDALHGLSASGTNTPPFDDCYVVHLGDQLESADLQAATNKVAEYLYANVATSLGAFLDRWRRGSSALAADEEGCPSLRVFGIHRYGSPRRRLAFLAANSFCGYLTERWQGENLGISEESVRQEIGAQLTALGLDAQAIESAFCAAALCALGDDAEKHFIEKVAALPPVPQGGNPGQCPVPSFAEALARVDAFFSAGQAPEVDEPPPGCIFEDALRKLAKELGGRLGRSSVQWLIGQVENPTRRVRWASHAANAIRHQISINAAALAQQLEHLRSERKTLRETLVSGAKTDKDSGPSWLGGLRAQQSAPGPYQRFAEYCLLRLKELALVKTMRVLESVGAQIAEWCGELVHVEQKLQNFGQTFLPTCSVLDLPLDGSTAPPAETELLPRDAGSLVDAAKKLTRRLAPKLAPAFEEAFQREVLDPHGGIWGFIRSSDERGKLVRESLFRRAFEAVLAATTEIDAAQLFVESRTDSDQAKQELAEQVATLAPNLDVANEMQQLVIAVPKSAPGAVVLEMLDPSNCDIPPSVLETDGDIIFCHEAVGLPHGELADFLAVNPERYVDAAAQVVTRSDVSWSFLELAKTNPQ